MKTLDDLRQVFSELLDKFLQHFRSNASRPSRVTSVPCQVVKNGGPGRHSVNIPPEVLEELRGLGFTWQKIASIFGVSRGTIMRRVRSFELQHLSLFSSITREHHHLFSSITRDKCSSSNKRTRRMIVPRDTPNILAIFCHVKPSPLNSSSTSGGMLTECRPGPPFFTT